MDDSFCEQATGAARTMVRAHLLNLIHSITLSIPTTLPQLRTHAFCPLAPRPLPAPFPHPPTNVLLASAPLFILLSRFQNKTVKSFEGLEEFCVEEQQQVVSKSLFADLMHLLVDEMFTSFHFLREKNNNNKKNERPRDQEGTEKVTATQWVQRRLILNH